MSLDASSYFDHLRAYLSKDYIVDEGGSGTISLIEKYFREDSTKKVTRKVALSFEGKAFAIKLDGSKERLFHFSMTMDARGLNAATLWSSSAIDALSRPIFSSSRQKA